MIRLRQEATKKLKQKQYQVGARRLRPRIPVTRLNKTMVKWWEGSLSM